MRKFDQSTLRNQRGVATVEFALILPLFLTLLFAIIEFGFLFKDQLLLQQVAREGARAAAVGKQVAEVRAKITSAAALLKTSNLSSTLQYRTYSSGWSGWATLGDRTTPAENDAPEGAQIVVKCTYTHPFLTGSLFASLIGRPGATTMPLYGQVAMRRE